MKLFKYSIITLVAIMILLFVIFFKNGFFLKNENKLSIRSDKGNVIPSKVYSRFVKCDASQKDERVYELLVFFADEDIKPFNPILFIPKYNFVGVVEGGKNEFLFMRNSVFQISKDANQFTILDSTYFGNNIPLRNVEFKKNQIIFNGLGSLQKYGSFFTINF